MKVFSKILYAVAAVGAVVLLYLRFVAQSITNQDLLMGICILVLAALSAYNASQQSKNGKNTTNYREAYAEFMGDSFADDKKLENKLFIALENLGGGRNKTAVKQLDKLVPLCRNDQERFTVNVFMGMAYSRCNEPSKAADSYNTALLYKESTTAWSNLGLCLTKLGDNEGAENAYLDAIYLDENNAYALNNLAQLYIHKKDYETALDYANRAFQKNDRIFQSINALAICHAMLGDEEKHEMYFNLAVRCGANGTALKEYIEELKKEE